MRNRPFLGDNLSHRKIFHISVNVFYHTASPERSQYQQSQLLDKTEVIAGDSDKRR